MPRPGGTATSWRAALRLTSDSDASLSRSSSRAEMLSRSAILTSAQRLAVSTRCTPTPRPRLAISSTVASISSISLRAAPQLSTIRNTSARRTRHVVTAGDAADVRSPCEGLQCTAAEVEAEELCLERGTRDHRGQQQGSEEGALARLRGADHRQVASLGEVRY